MICDTDGIVQYRGSNHIEINELVFGTDMMVMANPYMAELPMWVVALLMAGCIAAACQQRWGYF